MGKNPLISVIIPAYNVENYISRTLESVLNQSFKDFEIIVVNDGSTDKTEEVVRKVLRVSDIPFRVFSQSNKGVSIARNVGILNANGRYIKFLDADDVLKANGLKLLVETCEENDLVFSFGKQDVVDKNGKKILTYDQMYLVDWTLADYRTALEQFLKGLLHISCNSAIFRRDLIEKYGLFFTPGARFGEDTEFIAKYLFFSKKVVFVNEVICEAVLRFGSSTRVSNLSAFHNVGSFKRLLNFFKRVGEQEIVQILMDYSVPASYAWVMGNLAYNAYPYRLWIRLSKNATIRKMLKSMKIDFPKKTGYHKSLKLAKILYLISPSVTYFALRLIGKWHRLRYK